MKKTKKLLSLFIVAAMILSTMVMPASVSAAENLYPLGSFETFTETSELSSIVHNFSTGDRAYTLMTDGNGANGTDNYVKMTGSTWSQGSFQTPKIENLEPGKTYRATVYVKLVNPTVNGSTLKIRLKQTGDAVVATGSAIHNTVSNTAWTKVTLDYTIPEDDTKKNLIIQIYDEGRNDLFVDEVSLEEYNVSFPSWGTFEDVTDLASIKLTGSGATVTLATDGKGVNSSSNYVKVTGRGYQGANISTPAVDVEEGKAYKASFYIRLADGTADSSVTPQVLYTGNGTVFAGSAVTAKAGEWTKCEVEFGATADFSGKWGQSISMKAFQAGTVDLWYDDFELVEITKPALTTTHNLSSTTDVDTDSNTVITVDISNNVYNFSGKNDPTNSGAANDQTWSALASSNFTLSGGAGSISAEIKSNKQAILTLSGLEKGKTYTVALNGVTDYFGNTATAKTIVSFTTEAAIVVPPTPSNLCESWGNLENVTDLASIRLEGSGATATLVEDNTIAHSGSKFVKISGRTYQGANISTPSVDITEGRAYIAKFYVRLPEGIDDTTVIPQVNYTGSGAVFKSEEVAVTDDAWTECVVEFAGTAEFSGKWGQAVAMRANQAGTVDLLYDDFSITEIQKPSFTVTKDIQDNAAGVNASTKITVTFSNPAFGFSGKNDPSNTGVTSDQVFSQLSGANFEMKCEGTSVGSVNVTKKNSKTFELTLSGYESNREHKLYVKNVFDYFGNNISSYELLTFTTGVSELMPHSSFEGEITVQDLALNNTSYYSAEITSQTAKTGTKSLLISNRQNVSDGYYYSKALNVEQNQAYRMTAWVKLKNSEDAPRKAYMDAHTTGSGAKFRGEPATVTADEWTEISVEFAVTEQTKGRWGYDITARAYVEGSAGNLPDYYVDDVSVVKISTPALSATSPDEGSTDVAVNGTIEINFSNPVYNFSGKTEDAATNDQVFSNLNSDNFTLSGGSGSITVNRKSGTKYEIELSGLNPVTNYTITISGGVDYMGQSINDTITFRTSPYIFVQFGNILDNGDQSGNPYNPSFELPDTFQSGNFHDNTVRGTDFNAEIVSAESEGLEAVDGTNIFKITNRNVSVSPHTALRFMQVPGLQVGNRYKLTYYVRMVNPGESVTARAYFSRTAVNNNAVMPEINQQPTSTVTSDGWTEISGIVTLKEDTPGKPNLGMHVGMDVYGAGDLYVDGFRLEQMVPLPTLTSNMVDKASDINTDAELILTCSNPFSYDGVLPADVVIKKTADDSIVSDVVSVSKIDDNNYKIILTGLENGTKYKLVASGIKDVYRQEMNDLIINFSTTIATNVLRDYDTNFSFETGTTQGVITNATGEIVDASTVGITAPHGSKFLKVYNRTGNQGSQKFDGIGVGAASPLEAGKEYELSFYVRTLPNAGGDATTDTASVFFQNNGTSNTIKLGDVVAENFDISSSKWTRVSGRVKIEANNAQGTYQGINIGFSTGGTTAVYIDKYELREFYPEFTITTTPENGAIAITTETIKFKFSSELKTDLTEANFTITPSAPVESITKISSTEYDVKFDFDYNTHYKIEFNDLENKTFQFVSQVIEFSTSSGGGAADNNILAQYGFDWQADKGANGTEVPKVDFTAADGTTKQIYWDTSVYNKGQKPLISNADSYSGTGSILISDTTPDEYTWNFVKRRSRISYFPMEDGKTYVISAMLKLNDPMGIDSAQITFDLAGGEAASNLALLATSPKFEINGTEWTKVTATVDCTWKNKNITSDRPRTEAHVQIHNTSASYQFFIDDVIIYEVPTEPFILEGSNVADGETDASVSVGTIRFDYSQSLDENQNLNQDGLVTVWKGETNVTEDILNGQIVSGFGNKSVEVPLKALEHNSVYTIKISGLSSYAGKIAEDHQITFKTSKSVGYDDFVVLGDLGNQLAFENVPASEIHEISVNVSNLAIGTIKKPLIIYTIYDTATNQLIKVKTSTFDGDGSEVLADGAENQLIKLGVDAGDIQAGRRFTVYLVNGYDNTSLVAPPMTREF